MRYKLLFLLSILLSAPAAAQKLDADQPIEISADSLEVLQDQNKAIFTGNVDAVQGNTTLKADKMTVFYRKGGDNAAAQGAVSRIEVDGHVQIVTPTETGSGDKGAYNVDNKLVTLFGNVSLKRDKNVLKGERLEYSLATGRSLLTAGGGSPVAGKPATGGRVKGSFIPSKGAK